MKIRLLLLLLLLSVCAFSGLGQSVIEADSSVVINGKTADVSLIIERSGASKGSQVDLTILDTEGNVRARSSHSINLSAGKRKYKFAIPHNDLMKEAGDKLAWWRLSYRIDKVNGIASLSELLRDDFILRAAAFQRVIPGAPLRVRMRALNPVGEGAVKGVFIKAELSLSLETESDDDELNLKASGRTNGDGFALVEFDIPAGIKLDGDAEIVLTGQKNGVVRKIEGDLDEDIQGSVLMTTDKPLYQPGQTFSVRVLYLDANNTVVPDSELEISIEDEDDTVVNRQTVKTSAFGIASISWPISEGAKLGTYSVVVEADEDLREDQLRFKVSRYDLPNFAVTAKPDKTYYLPSDTEAQVTVAADYIFGKPVTGGDVRVVQETERKWNYRKQQYETEEGAISEGKADATGKFVAKFDLTKDRAELTGSEWIRYQDISFAAYYTDPTTNRTEQRRFDIRLTKEPIHIYFIQYARQHPDLPATAYLATFYADGTPAVCNVEVRDATAVAARVKTNSLGSSKFEIDIPRERVKRSVYEVRVSARDKKGNLGTFDGSFDIDTDDSIQITTDKAIYAPGDPIELDLRSTRRTGFVYVDVAKGMTPVESSVVELNDGKAHLSIPYRPTFKGDLAIAAYTDEEEGRWSRAMRAARGVVFPEQQNLILDAKFSKNEYRPNEEATVRFSVRDGSRKPSESAIGLGIFDKAIEERARTESEFGVGYFSQFYRLMGYDRSFGNLSIKDLNELDLNRPIEPEMQLAAEIMLAGNWYFPSIYHSPNFDGSARTVYAEQAAKQLSTAVVAMNAQFAKDHDHPSDLASLERILLTAGIDFAGMKDPWGQNYIAEFTVNRSRNLVDIKTSGADKKPGTSDDFNVASASFNYFTKTGEAIDRAVVNYHERTGRHIRDLQTLLTELARTGIQPAVLKDRWGRDYKTAFETAGRHYVIRISSVGPNGFSEPPNRGDDFEMWSTRSDYFAKSEREVNRILHEEVNLKKKPFPRSEVEFVQLLRRGGLSFSSIKDGDERPVYVIAKLESRYADTTKVEKGKTTITPVTEEMMIFTLRSTGSDIAMGSDDSDLAIFSGAVTQAHKGNGFVTVEVSTVFFSGAKGATSGTVVDPNGAVIPGAEVTATDAQDAARQFTARTDDDGKFLLANLPSGRYNIRISAPGFKVVIQQDVHVRSQSSVDVTVTLEIGGVSEAVEVSGAGEVNQTVNTTSASVSTSSVTGFKINLPYKDQTSTPRLREYFPESLVWQPELLTDKKGKAELKFKMADNITTWKMFAIASDKKGKVGIIEKEITAFQSFFVDLDPPKFLTEGDEIHLPAQVRNYTEQKQKVVVTMAPADWFTFLGAENERRVDVATGASQNAVFGFKAMTPVKAGKQRVTAVGQSDSDAIEKPVTVRPNGEEIVRTESKVFDKVATFDVTYPANALANTQKAELKIYPNLFSHVAESVEGMLVRPYGCGEQTISSTYPNLMILEFVKGDTPIRQKAQSYLQKGYERLIGYQSGDGGFTYWGGKDSADIALTAYAIRFLNDAKPHIDVSIEAIVKAEEWLVRQQRGDGSWTKLHNWERAENSDRTKLITTYVARSLAMRKGANKTALANAFVYLKQRNAEIDEPYSLALYGLASLDAGDGESAKQIASRLEKMAIAEGTGVYWKLETNTPFNGWGSAGRIETTALVLQLLTRTAQLESKPAGEIATKGLLFLLKNKDRYGVWYSTQTTINVLDAFLAILSTGGSAQTQTIQVAVNGVSLPDITVAGDRVELVNVDLDGKLSTSSNTIEVRSSTNSPLMAQTVATHYIDWRDSQSSNTNLGESRALRLDYKCDKPNASILEDVTCSVETERIGSKGYGMLLAEIGTPPGADVSRESLEAALQGDWSLSRYDVLPDRIVFYMWSKPGGTKFSFKFRPRYGIAAQTPASIVYDYYNPEAHATVVPLKFNVR